MPRLIAITAIVRQWLFAALAWLAVTGMVMVAWHLKHPLMAWCRAAETPLLLTLALSGLALLLVTLRRSATMGRNWQFRQFQQLLWLLVLICVLFLTIAKEREYQQQRATVLAAGDDVRLLGQHFIVGFTRYDEVAELAGKGLIAGVYLTRRNLRGHTVDDLAAQIASLQTLRRQAGLPPLLVTADQEGGSVEHLSPPLPNMPALATLADDLVPPPGRAASMNLRDTRWADTAWADMAWADMALHAKPNKISVKLGADHAVTAFPESSRPWLGSAFQYGLMQGKGLAALGVNLNFGPVVDLKPDRPSRDGLTNLYQRAIATDPQVVASIADAYIDGLCASGVGATLKHFPGLRRVHGDTHLHPASIQAREDQLRDDWAPFQQLIAHDSAAIMLAHVKLPDLDPEHAVSHSATIVHGLLRSQWQYAGVLLTDDLNMGAVYDLGIGRVATGALAAGVDLLLISYDPDQYYRAMHAAALALHEGRLNRATLAGSRERLTRFSRTIGLESLPCH